MAKKKKQKTPLRRITRSTGWMPATAVKIVKRGGHPAEVYLRKPSRKRKAAKKKKRR